MDPTTQNILRECADRLIQTSDLIARSSPAASTTTASTAAPAIAASTSLPPFVLSVIYKLEPHSPSKIFEVCKELFS